MLCPLVLICERKLLNLKQADSHQIASLKLTVVGVFTLRKLANAVTQSSPRLLQHNICYRA